MIRKKTLAVGADYLVTPYTLVGVAIGGGATKYGLSEGLGGGRSEMFQSALYSLTWINSFYVSTAAPSPGIASPPTER